MADQFVFLRVVRMNGVDLGIFRYDYDLTWMGFFIDADNRIYARYGGRDPESAEARVSKEGLLHTMKSVLRLHADAQAKKLPPPPPSPAKKPEEFPTLKAFTGDRCIRCHMINEAYTAEARRKGPIDRDTRSESFFAFPRSENVGIKPDLVLGNVIKEVTPDSPADRAGLKKGDVVRTLHAIPIVTACDMQYALNEVGTANRVTIEVERDGKHITAALALPEGWKRWDVSWRRSLWNIQPHLAFNGEDLSDEAKKKWNIPAGNLAYELRFAGPNGAMGRAGVKGGDIIVAVDGKRQIPYSHFRGYFALEHKPGDSVELIYLRGGKEQKATLTWK